MIVTLGTLAVPGSARRIVYLVDRSMSMGPSGALATALQEVAASLKSLPPNVLFQVIPYNRLAEPLELDGQRGLAPADPSTVQNAIEQLAAIRDCGMLALGAARGGGCTGSSEAILRAIDRRTTLG